MTLFPDGHFPLDCHFGRAVGGTITDQSQCSSAPPTVIRCGRFKLPARQSRRDIQVRIAGGTRPPGRAMNHVLPRLEPTLPGRNHPDGQRCADSQFTPAVGARPLRRTNVQST